MPCCRSLFLYLIHAGSPGCRGIASLGSLPALVLIGACAIRCGVRVYFFSSAGGIIAVRKCNLAIVSIVDQPYGYVKLSGGISISFVLGTTFGFHFCRHLLPILYTHVSSRVRTLFSDVGKRLCDSFPTCDSKNHRIPTQRLQEKIDGELS